MPECQNCEAHVSKKYVRIFCPPDREHPKACPECPDLMRVGTEIREKGHYGEIDEDAI